MKRIFFVQLLFVSFLLAISCTDTLSHHGDDGDSADSGNTADSVDSGNTADTADSGNTANTVDSGDTADSVDSGDTADSVDSGDTADSVDSGDTADSVDSGDTGDSGFVCSDNDGCPGRNQFCQKEACDDLLGQCEDKPTGCPYIYSPVCSCSHKTYDNACLAHQAGENIQYTGECLSSVTYKYVNLGGMPPITLSGELHVIDGGQDHLFDSPDAPVRDSKRITVAFHISGDRDNIVYFHFNLGDFPNQICTDVQPCKITFGGGKKSIAIWEASGPDGHYYQNGELTGTVYVTENADNSGVPGGRSAFIFHADALTFHPFG